MDFVLSDVHLNINNSEEVHIGNEKKLLQYHTKLPNMRAMKTRFEYRIPEKTSNCIQEIPYQQPTLPVPFPATPQGKPDSKGCIYDKDGDLVITIGRNCSEVLTIGLPQTWKVREIKFFTLKVREMKSFVLSQGKSEFFKPSCLIGENVNKVSNNHFMVTPLDLVGLQVWQGALLLGDYLLHTGRTVLDKAAVIELGAGTGLCSLVAALFAETVIVTDYDEGVLELCQRNVLQNHHPQMAHVRVKKLDWNHGINFQPSVDPRWSWGAEDQADVTKLRVALAADGMT